MNLAASNGVVSRPPDFMGQAGKAWQVDTNALLAKYAGITVEAAKELNSGFCWVVFLPGPNPLWWWYRLLLIDLSPRPGVSDSTIYLPGATHEIILDAINPEHYPPSVDAVPYQVLTPTNFAAQFIIEASGERSKNRAAISHVIAKAVLPLVCGELSPDTDYRSQWIARFGDNMIRK